MESVRYGRLQNSKFCLVRILQALVSEQNPLTFFRLLTQTNKQTIDTFTIKNCRFKRINKCFVNSFNPACHFVDDIQNPKEIFCTLSFKLNLFITRGSFYNSKFLSSFIFSNNDAKFQTQSIVTTECKR